MSCKKNSLSRKLFLIYCLNLYKLEATENTSKEWSYLKPNTWPIFNKKNNIGQNSVINPNAFNLNKNEGQDLDESFYSIAYSEDKQNNEKQIKDEKKSKNLENNNTKEKNTKNNIKEDKKIETVIVKQDKVAENTNEPGWIKKIWTSIQEYFKEKVINFSKVSIVLGLIGMYFNFSTTACSLIANFFINYLKYVNDNKTSLENDFKDKNFLTRGLEKGLLYLINKIPNVTKFIIDDGKKFVYLITILTNFFYLSSTEYNIIRDQLQDQRLDKLEFMKECTSFKTQNVCDSEYLSVNSPILGESFSKIYNFVHSAVFDSLVPITNNIVLENLEKKGLDLYSPEEKIAIEEEKIKKEEEKKEEEKNKPILVTNTPKVTKKNITSEESKNIDSIYSPDEAAFIKQRKEFEEEISNKQKEIKDPKNQDTKKRLNEELDTIKKNLYDLETNKKNEEIEKAKTNNQNTDILEEEKNRLTFHLNEDKLKRKIEILKTKNNRTESEINDLLTKIEELKNLRLNENKKSKKKKINILKSKMEDKSIDSKEKEKLNKKLNELELGLNNVEIKIKKSSLEEKIKVLETTKNITNEQKNILTTLKQDLQKLNNKDKTIKPVLKKEKSKVFVVSLGLVLVLATGILYMVNNKDSEEL